MIKKTFIADKNRKLSKLALYNIENLSYAAFMRALREKDVKVNGRRVDKDAVLSVGDTVEIFYRQNDVIGYVKIFADNNVLVVYKKKGFTSESVFSAVKEDFPSAGFIHRLDRNTDGVMIFSLNGEAERELLKGFKNRIFDKKYTALAVGKMPKREDVLSAYLFKDEKAASVTVSDSPIKGGVKIKTGYKVIKENAETSLLSVTLYTGKTHQIRAHLAHIGHPVVGDGKYGDFDFNARVGEKTQNLTATELVLHFDESSPLYYLDGKKFNVNEL